MKLSNLLIRVLESLRRSRRRRSAGHLRRRPPLASGRPAFEPLESRVLLSTLPVSGAGGFFDPIEDMGRADRISGDGQYVVFTSLNALDGSDTNGQNDIYLYQFSSGTVSLVSHNSAGTGAGSGESLNPQISRDGAYVVFTSLASDLVAGDANNNLDVFLYERATGVIRLVSHVSGGPASGNGSSDVASISGDGRYVAYLSSASNLLPGDGNGAVDVFLYDRVSAGNTLVSTAFASGNSSNGYSDRPQVSADGNYVAFQSDASDLTSNADNNGSDDVFLYHRATGVNTLVSRVGLASAAGSSSQPSLSDDGGYVSFQSTADNLAAADSNGNSDVLLYDRVAGMVSLLSWNSGGSNGGNQASFNSQVSGDGSAVVFTSSASDLVASDSNAASDVFYYDVAGASLSLASGNGGGSSGNGASFDPVVNGDGAYVIFNSLASDLAVADSNGVADVFLYRPATNSVALGSLNLAGNDSPAGPSYFPTISNDGAYFAFTSAAPDNQLISPGADNGEEDLFLVDIASTGPNVAPVLTTSPGSTLYTWGGSFKVIDDAATVSDVDSADFSGGALTISITTMAATQDRLSIQNQGTAPGQIRIAAGNVSYNPGSGSVVIGAYAGGSGLTPLVITLNANAEVVATQALMRAITYRNTLAFPPVGDRVASFVLTDGDGGTSNTADKTIAFEQNLAPSINNPANDLDAIDEDPVANPGTLVADIIVGSFSDPNTVSLSGLALTVAASVNGAWQYSINGGATWGNVGTVSATSALLLRDEDLLRFVPTANYNGSRNITLKAWDQSAGTRGTKVNPVYSANGAFSSGTAGASLTINPINDPPVLGGISGVLAYVENAAPLRLATTATVTDGDSPNFATGSLSVAIAANGAAEDRLAIRNVGVGAGQIGVSGSNVTYSGVVIGSFAGGGDGFTPLVVTLNANAAIAATRTLIRNLTYQNVSEAPSTLQRTVSFTLDDGDGGVSNTPSRPVSVTSVNDFPVNTTPGAQVTPEDTPLTFSTGNGKLISVNDVDAGAGDLRITLTCTRGTVTLAQTTGLIFSQGDGLNDAVTTFRGSIANLNAALDGVVFTPQANWVGACNLRVTTNDLGNTGSGGARTTITNIPITTTAVNDPPVLGGISGAVTYIENAVPLLIATAATVTDVDSPNFNTGSLTVAITANGDADDRLAIRNQGVGAGQIGVAGSNVTYSGVVIGSFVGGGDGSTPLVVTLNANATIVATRTLIRNLTYQNVSDAPSTLQRTVSFTLDDGNGGVSNSPTRLINVSARNDAPVLIGPAINFTAINEDDVNNPGDLVGDLIAGRITDADPPVTLEGIAITARGVNGTWQYSLNAGASWTNFPTVSNNAALLLRDIDRVRFRPAANFSGNSSITYRAWDQTVGVAGTRRSTATNGGITAFSTALLTSSITVTPVNDGPIIGTFAGTSAYTENAVPRLLATTATVTDPDSANFAGGNLTAWVSVNNDAGDLLQILHQGAGANQVAVSGSNISYNFGAGSILIGTFVGGDGVNPLVVSFNANATPVAARGVLRRLAYSSTNDAFTAASRVVSVAIDDGAGGISATVNRTVNITLRNDAPVLTGINNFTNIAMNDFTNTGDMVGNLIAGFVTDPDGPAALQGIAVYQVSNVGGTWQYSSNGGTSWTNFGAPTITAARLLPEAARVRFRPNAGFTGGSFLRLVAWDQTAGTPYGRRNASTRGGTTPFSIATATATIQVI